MNLLYKDYGFLPVNNYSAWEVFKCFGMYAASNDNEEMGNYYD